jgi:glyoxylate/hydroxypyruvate reductase
MLDYNLDYVDSVLLDQFPSVRCVVSANVGVNHIDVEECKRRGVQVANAGHIYSTDVADYAVGLLIDVLRKINQSDLYVKEGLWSVRENYPLGSTV